MATSTVRPYLSRNDLYTLSWACYPVVCILFVAFHLKLATNSVADGVEDAKQALTASCNAAQKAATVAVSLPRYLAKGTLARLFPYWVDLCKQIGNGQLLVGLGNSDVLHVLHVPPPEHMHVVVVVVVVVRVHAFMRSCV